MTVLLVDDQAIIAEAVRRMLADESDISFHYCNDPTKAIEQANHWLRRSFCKIWSCRRSTD